MIDRILTERQEALRVEERELLADLASVLRRVGDPAAERVEVGVRQLGELFVVSVSGAPDAVVEDLARALVGDSPPPELAVVAEREGEVRPPAGRAVDLALFLTSAHRPLPPAEHAALRAASEGAGRLLVVVDEAEMLRLSEDLGRMEEAVEVTAGRLLGDRPPRFLAVQMVSTARAGATPSRESLVPSLAGRVAGVLRSPDVLRPKLLAPAETALEVARERLATAEAGLAALGDDLANLELLERELEGLREAAERALREAEEEAARAVAELGERAGRLVGRGSRPFPLGRGSHRRLETEAAEELPERLRKIGNRLDERIGAAAQAARQAVEERVTSFPTERTRTSGREAAGRRGEAAPPAGAEPAPVVAELERTGVDRWAGGLRALAPELRRTSVVSMVLLGIGLAFATVPAISAATGGVGVLTVALGGGLGGAAVLAALANLKLGRQRLTRELARHLDDLRTEAAAALAAGAERAVAEARAAVQAPVARYVDGVAAERDRLVAARDAFEPLARRLEDLRRRLAEA